MMGDAMTYKRVIELIEAYGANAETWPDDERAHALAQIEAEPARFEAALEAARELDLAFAEIDDVPEISPGLEMMILADASIKTEASLGSTSVSRPSRARIQWSTGAIIAAMLTGLLGGYSYAASSTATDFDQAENAYDAMLGDSDWVFLDTEEAP